MKKYLLAASIIFTFSDATFAASDAKRVLEIKSQQELLAKNLEVATETLASANEMTTRFERLKELITLTAKNKKNKPILIKSFKALIKDFNACYNDEKSVTWRFNTEETSRILADWDRETETALKIIDQKEADVCGMVNAIAPIAVAYEDKIQEAVLTTLAISEDSIELLEPSEPEDESSSSSSSKGNRKRVLDASSGGVITRSKRGK